VTWEEVRLPTTTEPGYGEKVLPATELIESLGGDPKPLVVWFYSLEDEKENRTLETSVYTNEPIALSLRKYRTVKIDVESIADGKLRREYRETPGFLVIDPHKEVLAELKGKSAVSVSRFKGFVAQSWSALFEMRQRDFLKGMTKILDELDKISGKKTILQAKKARLAKRPNPGKARALAKEEAELAAAEAAVQQKEEDLKNRCKLKDRYLKPAGEAGEK
jgi:hypothetical protein